VVLRLARAAAMMLIGVGVAMMYPVLGTSARRVVLRSWFRGLLTAFGVRLAVDGAENLDDRRGALLASNHVSWLDVVALQAVCPMRLLAKMELRDWPVLGALAGRAGTLYIDRDSLRTLPDAVRGIAEALRKGSVVGVFPEGTTWCGVASGRHRPAVFQAAVDADAPVHPVALRFRFEEGQRTTVAAFVGEDTLITSLLAVARVRGLVVELFVLPALDAGELADRRELSRQVEASITEVTTPASTADPVPHEVSCLAA
jgi:1-acyl-sn-glycerol-3-phosphate acyltransferase